MIFVVYEPGSKGYKFWNAAHRHFKIPHDVKFEETCFPVKGMKLAQPTLAPLSSHQIPESDNKSDSLGLDLVHLAQPPTRPPRPGLSASGQPVILPQSARLYSPPLPHPGLHEVLSHPCQAWRLFHINPQHLDILCTQQRCNKKEKAGPSTDTINSVLIHMF